MIPKPIVGRPPKDAPRQKYDNEAMRILGRMNQARTVGRSPKQQAEGLATFIRREDFWTDLMAQPVDVRAMIMEAHARSWAILKRAAWLKMEPF